MMRVKIALLAIFVVFFSAYSQNSFRQATYKSYAARDFSGWPLILEQMQVQAFSPEGTLENQVQLLVNYYGYIGSLLDTNQKSKASIWTKKGNEVVKRVKVNHPNQASVLALESMFIAFQIAINPIKAPLYISSMMSSVKHAMKIDPNHYLANIAHANILFYFPSALGGDKLQAISYYKKVYNHFKSTPLAATDNWVYLNIISTLGVANNEIGNVSEARRWCEEALKVEPNFVFVNTVLLPSINKSKKK